MANNPNLYINYIYSLIKLKLTYTMSFNITCTVFK